MTRNLNVPFVWQESDASCVAASILMIHQKYYGGNSGVTQQQIKNYFWTNLGVHHYDATWGQIATVLNHYAPFIPWAGHQAWNLEPQNLEFLAATADSIYDYAPVMVYMDFAHSGVINKGKVRRVSSTEPQHRLEWVYVHDPFFGPDRFWTAGDFLSRVVCDQGLCSQAINQNYPPLGEGHLVEYGAEFRVNGYVCEMCGGEWPPENWPPEY